MSVIERRHLIEQWTEERRASPRRLRQCYVARADSIAQARTAIAEFAASVGVHGEQLDAIKLAASEALTNIVQYAYPAVPGTIHVTAWLAGGEMWLLIADTGCGLHAGCESAGLGLGLALISEMADGFSVVERSSGGTELRIRFALDA